MLLSIGIKNIILVLLIILILHFLLNILIEKSPKPVDTFKEKNEMLKYVLMEDMPKPHCKPMIEEITKPDIVFQECDNKVEENIMNDYDAFDGFDINYQTL